MDTIETSEALGRAELVCRDPNPATTYARRVMHDRDPGALLGDDGDMETTSALANAE